MLRKGKPRCKYGLGLHGDARLAQVSRMLGACVPYFVKDRLGYPCGLLRPLSKTLPIRTCSPHLSLRPSNCRTSRTPSVRLPYGITCTDTARLLWEMKVIRMAILQLPRELHGHIHEIKNRMRSRKIKMGLKIVRSRNRACGCDSGFWYHRFVARVNIYDQKSKYNLQSSYMTYGINNIFSTLDLKKTSSIRHCSIRLFVWWFRVFLYITFLNKPSKWEM